MECSFELRFDSIDLSSPHFTSFFSYVHAFNSLHIRFIRYHLLIHIPLEPAIYRPSFDFVVFFCEIFPRIRVSRFRFDSPSESTLLPSLTLSSVVLLLDSNIGFRKQGQLSRGLLSFFPCSHSPSTFFPLFSSPPHTPLPRCKIPPS